VCIIQMYNLSASDVNEIKEMFDRSRRGYDPKIKTTRVTDVFELMVQNIFELCYLRIF
jgi:hypothetical protein